MRLFLKIIFGASLLLVSALISANASKSKKLEAVETITSEYEDLTKYEAQRLEKSTVLSVKYLMKTQRDLKENLILELEMK